MESAWSSNFALGNPVSSSRGCGSFVASLMHGAKVVIKPIQTFFHNGLVGRDMARVEEDMAFPRIGHPQKTKKWELGRIHWEHKIVAAIQHERWHLYARSKIQRLDLRRQFFKGKPSAKQHASLEAWLNCRHDRSPNGTQAESIVGQAMGIDVFSSREIIDGSLYVFAPLHDQISPSFRSYGKASASGLNYFIKSLS